MSSKLFQIIFITKRRCIKFMYFISIVLSNVYSILSISFFWFSIIWNLICNVTIIKQEIHLSKCGIWCFREGSCMKLTAITKISWASNLTTTTQDFYLLVSTGYYAVHNLKLFQLIISWQTVILYICKYVVVLWTIK